MTFNSVEFLALGFLRPLSTWRLYPLTPVSVEEYHRMPVIARGRRIAAVGELVAKTRSAPGMSLLESQFLFRYGAALSADHRKIRAMEGIVDACRAGGMEPFFYIYPIDVSAGERAAGPGFREQVALNVEVLRRRMADRKARLLDLSFALESDDFDWTVTGIPNEHLNEQGRRKVARELEKFVRAR